MIMHLIYGLEFFIRHHDKNVYKLQCEQAAVMCTVGYKSSLKSDSKYKELNQMVHLVQQV